MKIAIFDLDNTLLAGDSDYLWAQYLIEHNIVDGEYYEKQNNFFYDEYKKGTLDIFEFLDFQLEPLSRFSMQELNEMHRQFMAEKIRDIILPKAVELIEHHREQQHTLMIITATNRFVTEPIAHELGVEHLIATEPEVVDNRYTGKVTGVPCFQDGKVKRFDDWMAVNNSSIDKTWFYSDSHNDIPLLEKVTVPVAVDADDKLTEYASEKGWKQISLR